MLPRRASRLGPPVRDPDGRRGARPGTPPTEESGEAARRRGVQALVAVPPSVSGRTLKEQWERLIKQVYEIGSLLCLRWRGSMRILAFIEQPEVIEKILIHLSACNK